MSAPFPGTPTGRRTFQPVRRFSYNVGEREHRCWRPLGRTRKEVWEFKDALLLAAKLHDRDTKAPGEYRGALGLSGREVLEALVGIADNLTGRLEPSLAWIQAKTKLARGTVVRALKRLKEAGFLDWIRRTEPVENAGAAGPQVKQATNAYWFDLKGKASSLVYRLLRKRRSPPPDDALARVDQDRAATEAMLAKASAENAARFRLGDSPLGDALASLGRSIDQGASSKSGLNPEPEG